MSSQATPKFRRSSSRMYDGMLVEEAIEIQVDSSEAWVLPEPDEPKSTPFSCELDADGKCLSPGRMSHCRHSLYGKPIEQSKIKKIMDWEGNKEGEDGGLIWRALLLPADFDKSFAKNGKLTMLTSNHYDAKNHCVKPRRGMMAVTESDFFSSLTIVNIRGKTPRWVFSGVLNGWPGLTCLELLKIEFQGALPTWREHWNTNEGVKPTYPKGHLITEVRAKLRAPSWSAYGWSKESTGYYLWYEGQATVPRLLFGTNILKTYEKERLVSGDPSPRCVKIHNIAHRYSVGDHEGVKGRNSYHSFSLMEWDHGKYMTVVELGIVNGLSGYNGKSNWLEDKNDVTNGLNTCIPSELIAPWRSSLPELRCTDVAAKSVDEHLAYMKRHTGKHQRFLDVQLIFSHTVRLSFNSQEHITQYLQNYAQRERTYSEIQSNCQTFTSDFSAFLAGKKDIQPYHPVNRIAYRNKAYYFLYDGSMYPDV